MTRQVLVLGGSGCIGSHMYMHLAEAPCAVRVIDNLAAGQADAAACKWFSNHH